MRQQPRQLYILSMAQMLKFFSHYGNRALLVLYMVGAMGLTDKHAFGIYAVYGGLVELGAAFGGILADRYIGRRRAVMLGAVVIALGHLLMTFGASFYLGLGAIAVGSLFFSTNLFTLLSEYYEKEDSRRERGFTILYILMNIGALAATMLCSYLAMRLGWHKGFGLAAIGMLFCCALLVYYRTELVEKPRKIDKKGRIWVFSALPFLLIASAVLIAYERYSLPILPVITLALFGYFGYSMRHDTKRIYYLIALILFLALEEQICTSILLYSERNTTCFLGSGFLISVNPIMIIIAGPLIYPFSKMIGRFRVPFIFGFLAIAFGIFSSLLLLNIKVSYFGVAALVAAITIGELVLTPFIYALFSEKGSTMAIIPIGYALSAQLGGILSKSLAVEGGLVAYGVCYAKVSVVLIAITLLALFIRKPVAVSPQTV